MKAAGVKSADLQAVLKSCAFLLRQLVKKKVGAEQQAERLKPLGFTTELLSVVSDGVSWTLKEQSSHVKTDPAPNQDAAMKSLQTSMKVKEMEIDMLKMELDAERSDAERARATVKRATEELQGTALEELVFFDAALTGPVRLSASTGEDDSDDETEQQEAAAEVETRAKWSVSATAAELVSSTNLDLLSVFLRATLKHRLDQNLTDDQLDMLEEMTEEEYPGVNAAGHILPKIMQLLNRLLGCAIRGTTTSATMVAEAMQPTLEELSISNSSACAASIVAIGEYLHRRTSEIGSKPMLRVSIPRTKLRKDEKGPHTIYVLEIMTPEGKRKWGTEKRYSAFATLYSGLVGAASEGVAARLPRLPPKLMGKARLEEAVVEARRIDLEKFVRRLSLNTELMETDAARGIWHDFLKTPPDLRHAGALRKTPNLVAPAETIAGSNQWIFPALQIIDNTDERRVLCCVSGGLAIMEAPEGDSSASSLDPNGMTSQKVWGYYPGSVIAAVEASTCNRGQTRTCEVSLAVGKRDGVAVAADVAATATGVAKPMRFCLADPEPLVDGLKSTMYKDAQSPLFVDKFFKRCVHTNPKLVRWQPNRETNTCTACQVVFKKLSKNNRRHHCRHCGFIYCNTCSGKTLTLTEMGHQEPVRVCTHCFEVLRASRQYTKLGSFTFKRVDQLDPDAKRL
jgi:hypothetical protein